MRLNRRLQKAIAVAAVSTIALTAVPAFASDYKGHWAENAITEWSQKGIVAGYEDGTFRPTQAVTRAELAAFITRIFGLEDTSQAKVYGDVKANSWYQAVVGKVSSAGIMTDYGTQFKPNAPATREEAAYAIATAYKITQAETLKFADKDKISDQSIKQVAGLVAGNYISGRPDGTFGPKDTLTRADIVSMIDKITAELYNKAGTYTNNVTGNVVVNTKDVILKNMTITGNLYLAEGIGEGDVTLNTVKVTGKVYVEGGGTQSIKLQNTTLNQVEISKAVGNVRIAADAKSEVKQLVAQSPAKLEGKFGKVEIATKEAMQFVNAQVAEVKITAKDAKVNFDEKSVVAKVIADVKVALENKGKIKEAVINANGVKITGKQAEKMEVAKTVTEQPNIADATKPSTGGGGGGGGGGSSSGGGSVTPAQDPHITFGNLKINAGGTEITKAVSNNVIELSKSDFTAHTGAQVSGVLLELPNVNKGSLVTLSYKDGVMNNAQTQTFRANEGYTLEQFFNFANMNRTKIDQTLKALKVTPEQIASFEKEAGVNLNDLMPADGAVSIDQTVKMFDKLQALYMNGSDSRKAKIKLMVEMLGVDTITEGDKIVGYETKATLKAPKHKDTTVTIRVKF